MKKIIIVFLVLTEIVFVKKTNAQNNGIMHVRTINHVTTDYNISDIDSIWFSPCNSTDDKTPPVITLKGNTLILLQLGESFSDKTGATAFDDKDGDITKNIIITGVPANSDQAGEFIIKYDVSDATGNKAIEVTQILHIGTEPLTGTYLNVTELKDGAPVDSAYHYDATVTQSNTVFNKIFITNFGGYGNNITIEAIVNGTIITLISQDITIGGMAANISGTGSYTKNTNGTFSITQFKYTEKIYGGGTTSYTGTFPKQQ